MAVPQVIGKALFDEDVNDHVEVGEDDVPIAQDCANNGQNNQPG